MSANESTPDNTVIYIRLADGTKLANSPTTGRSWAQRSAGDRPNGVVATNLSIGQYITLQLKRNPPPVVTHLVDDGPERPGIPSWVR